MSQIEAYKYHVIQLLDETYTGTLDYVCVPRSWVEPNDDEDNPLVNVWYPEEDHKYTERRVRNREKKSNQWKSFLSLVKFSTNNYEDARSYVLKQTNQETKQGDSNDDEKKCNQDEMNMNTSERTNGDHTTLSETAEENEAKIDNEDHLMNILETKRWYVSSKSTNFLSIKRKTPQKPEKEAPNNRSRESELDESDDDVVGLSSQANKNKENSQHLSRSHEFFDEDLGTYETHIDKTNDGHSSENRQTLNRDPSKANQSWDTEILAKLIQLAKLTSELKKGMGNEILKPLLNELLNTDDGHYSQNKFTITSAPSDITAGVPKFNEKKINEKQPKEKDIDFEPTKNKKNHELKLVLTSKYNENDSKKENNNDDDYSEPLQRKCCPKRFKKVTQSPEYVTIDSEKENDMYGKRPKRKSGPKRFKELFGPSDSDEEGIDDADKYEDPFKEKCSPKRAKKVVLPPDYDAYDSRWTLKYRELKQGLVELEEGTGVYVSASRLSYYKKYSRDGREFARNLLREIFTKSALSTCSWTGARARAYDRDGTNIRPGLDLVARTLLLEYASHHAKMEGWPNWDTETILRSIRNKLLKTRP